MKKKIISSFSFTLLSSGLFFLFNFSLAKILGAGIYGEIVYYLSFIQIIALIISMNYAALYMGSKITNGDKETFSLFFSLQSLLFLLIVIPAFILLQPFFQSIEERVLILLLSYFLVFIVMVGLEYNANKDVVGSILFSMLIPRVLLITFFVLLILLGEASSKNYLYVYLLSSLSVVIYFMQKFRPHWYMKKEIFSRAWKFYLLGIIGSSFTYIAQILQKEYTGYEELATLAIVLLIFSGLNLVGTVLVKFILPKIHECYRNGALEEIGELYANNTFVVLLVITPLLFLLIFNIEEIATMLGEGYGLLPSYFYILLAGYLVDLLTGITGHILRSTENEKFEIFNEIVRLISGLFLIYIFRESTFGIIMAISLSMIIYNLLKYIEVFYLFSFLAIKVERIQYILSFLLLIGVLIFMTSLIDIFTLHLLLSMLVLLLGYFLIYKYIRSDLTLLKGYR